MDNEKTIAEINEVIARVEAGLEPGCEIGARDKITLKGLLKANHIDKTIKFFPCKRENSAKIIAHFVKGKGIPQSRFSINAQPGIFILCDAGAKPGSDQDRQSKQPATTPAEESKVLKPEKATAKVNKRQEEKAKKASPKKTTAPKKKTVRKGKTKGKK